MELRIKTESHAYNKDDIIAKAAAEKIAASLGLNVTVTAGIHWDNLDREGINRIIDNSKERDNVGNGHTRVSRSS